MSEVRIEHVFKRFGGVTAVNDFNLVVKDGEFVSILGPSGCGKTTTLQASSVPPRVKFILVSNA